MERYFATDSLAHATSASEPRAAMAAEAWGSVMTLATCQRNTPVSRWTPAESVSSQAVVLSAETSALIAVMDQSVEKFDAEELPDKRDRANSQLRGRRALRTAQPSRLGFAERKPYIRTLCAENSRR